MLSLLARRIRLAAPVMAPALVVMSMVPPAAWVWAVPSPSDAEAAVMR